MWRIIDPLKFGPMIEPPRANDAIIAVTEEMMEEILQLPDDIEIIGIYPDPRRRSLLVRVRSPRFPRSVEGNELYEYHLTTVTREFDGSTPRHPVRITYNFESFPHIDPINAGVDSVTTSLPHDIMSVPMLSAINDEE